MNMILCYSGIASGQIAFIEILLSDDFACFKVLSVQMSNIVFTGRHGRTSPKNLEGAMKFCPNLVTFAQIMIF